ncbi:hypothetical protein LCGC14_0913450, partial [marine sediment metagenome]
GGGTVEIWFDNDVQAVNGGLVTKIQSSLVAGSVAGGLYQLLFTYQFTGGAGQWVSTTILTPATGWNHFAITYDSGNIANNPIFYVNGVATGFTELLTPAGVRVSDAGDDLVFGNAQPANNEVNGQLDDIRLWTDIRTPAEILANFQIQLVGNEAGLVGYWPLDSAVMELTFESDELRQTTAGTAALWDWIGIADDTSLESGTNDGLYTLNLRDPTGITVTVNSVILKELPTVPLIGQLLTDVLGSIGTNLGGVTGNPVQVDGLEIFPFLPIIDNAATDAGIPLDALRLLVLATLALLIAIPIVRTTKLDWLGLTVIGIVLFLGAVGNLYPIWVIFLYGTIALGIFAAGRMVKVGEL